MSEKGNCTNATDDAGVKVEKDKEAKEESEKTESEYDKETIEGRGKEEKNADDGQVPNEENRRKSSDFWLLWPAPSTRAMARFFFEKQCHHHSFFTNSGRWDPSLDPQVLQAGRRCGGQRTQTS